MTELPLEITSLIRGVMAERDAAIVRAEKAERLVQEYRLELLNAVWVHRRPSALRTRIERFLDEHA